MNQTLDRIDLDDLFDLDLMVLTGAQLPEAASRLTEYGCQLTTPDACIPTGACPTQASSCNSAGQTGKPCHCF